MITPIKYIVYRVLPLVYDDSLSYLEILAKVTAKTNEVIEQINSISGQMENMDEYIRETAEQIVSETVTPEYVQTIITEQYLNTWLADNAIISVIENDISTNTEDIRDLKTRMTDEEQATQGLNTGLQNAITDFENFEDETNSTLQEQQTQIANKADDDHTHDLSASDITGVLPWSKGGTNQTSAQALQHLMFKALTATGAEDNETLSAYPTSPATGLFRVGTRIIGLPADSNGFGVLAIFKTGDYSLHMYMDNQENVYIKNSYAIGTNWKKCTMTSASPYNP